MVDQHTFVIVEVDGSGNFIRHLVAFNKFGALNLDPKPNSGVQLYVPRPSGKSDVGAPTVTDFDETLYDIKDPNSIVNILKGFYENNNLISYQRIQDRVEEFEIWEDICNSLFFIRDFF